MPLLDMDLEFTNYCYYFHFLLLLLIIDNNDEVCLHWFLFEISKYIIMIPPRLNKLIVCRALCIMSISSLTFVYMTDYSTSVAYFCTQTWIFQCNNKVFRSLKKKFTIRFSKSYCNIQLKKKILWIFMQVEFFFGGGGCFLWFKIAVPLVYGHKIGI